MLWIGAAAFIALTAPLLSQGGFYGGLVTQMLIFAIAAMGLDFLGGFGGLVSFGQASYLGLGAYGVAVSMRYGYGPWTAVGISLVVILLVALIVGPLAVRVSGIGFVIMTLALGQILFGLAFSWVGVSGGDNGLPILSAPVLGPIDLNKPSHMSFAVLAVFILSAWLLRTFVTSPFGLSLRGMMSNEQRLRTLGYATRLHRYVAYVISVFFGGLAGILFAFSNGLISPTAMDFHHNGVITIMAVLGGLGTLWGPVLGAVIIILFQQYLSIYVDRWATAMGVVFIAIMLFVPEGVWGLARKGARRLGRQLGRPAADGATTRALSAEAREPHRDGQNDGSGDEAEVRA
ncbi:branched-chain amino acid ABC transporter permease [Planosporangium flavigriseum]|uniref:Branched-chain amino acid ABC transporter permease n=2 Tax=Planosporangium flavigriseum TaxID=373681 RepID=A0A8J3PN35_9ACTN|nr:branched-chain amino acid ABC transporter permease [Planosporangium flavigriseum]